MAQPFEALFWTPHAAFHRKLQDGNIQKPVLDDQFDWLLYGTQKFKPCNEASRKQIMEKLKLEVKGKTFVYDAKLRPLALRAAKLLDLDEAQTMLLLKRWLKDHESELKPEDLAENDHVAVNDLMLQVLRYYHSERILLLKCIQVVMLKAGEGDEAGKDLGELLARLISSNVEEQLHTRLRENLEGGAAAITRRLKAFDDSAAPAATAAGAAAAAGALTTTTGAVGIAASLGWLSAAHGAMRSQLVSERLELLNCLLLLHEVCNVACKPERAQALARLLLDRVFASVQLNGNGNGGGAAAAATADSATLLSQQLAALLLLSCLDLPGHVRLAAAAAAPATPAGGGGGSAAAADTQLPLGGKTMDVHNQLSQYDASPSTALLLLTWGGCLRLLDIGAGGHMIRNLDGAARELEARVSAIGGLRTAASALAALCSGAVGALLLVYREVATKALCVLCTAFDLGVDTLDPATYEVVAALVKLCVEGDARACAALWDESVPATAPLRALLSSAARLFPAVPHYLLQLLHATAASADTARSAYAFLQRAVSLVVLHSATEGAIRPLGGGEVELAAALPWNLAPSVPGLALPQGCVGTLYPLPAVLSELRGRCVLVSWDAEVSGGGGQSRGQVLLLGRASHCVASLEHALLHNLPLERSDPTLLQDLADTLSLLAGLCGHEPGLVKDLLLQSVPFSSGTTRSWTDVVAGVLAIGPQLVGRLAAAATDPHQQQDEQQPQGSRKTPPSALQLLADAAHLLGAIAALSPGRVLPLLPLLPILSSPVPDLLAGLPAAVPLDALPDFTVPPCIESFCGLLPALSALQRDLERPAGRYPLTVALLELLAGLLERGFVAAPLPSAALFVLYELLPNHHQWRFASAKERWALTRGSLRVLRLALTAGAYVTDADISSISATPPATAAAAAAAPAASGSTLMLTYGNSSAAAATQPAADDGGSSSLTPEQLMQAATPRLHVSVMSAALLKLLLLHGGVLLARSLPPPADTLEALRGEDASRPELPLMEGCAAEVVQLLPPLLAAACAHTEEQPFEEFLLAGQDPTPAAHVASYIAYHEADWDLVPPERQVSYLALRALLSIASCVARPVSRSLPGVSLSLAVPGGSPAEACLRALLRGEGATQHPAHYALGAQLAADCVGSHDKLLDALLFPSELEEEHARQQQQQAGAAGAGGQPLLALPPPGGPGGGAGAGPPRRGARFRQALDGLYSTVQQAARLKREQPQVLSSALRVLAAMWRQPAAAHRAVTVLRSARALWPSLEACLAPVQPQDPQEPAASSHADVERASHRALCEALTLQILTAEAFARSRSGTAAAAAGAGGAGGGGGAQGLLENLVRGGQLLRLLRSAACHPASGVPGAGAEAEAVGALQRVAAALYLEMGTAVVSGLWSQPADPDGVALAACVREELAGVGALVAQGIAVMDDVQSVHDDLLAGAGATRGSTGGQSADETMAMTHPSHPLAQLLQRQCLGGALISRCNVATADLAHLPGGPVPPLPGPDHLLSRSRLLTLLGPAVEALHSVDLLAGALVGVSITSSLAESRLALLQAGCALTAVLARDGRLLLPTATGAEAAAAALLDPPAPAAATAADPATPGGAGPSSGSSSGGGGVLTSAHSVCAAAVSSLLSWCSDPDSRAALQPGWGLRRLHAQHLAAALAAARLLLSAMQAARPALAAGGGAATAGGGGGTSSRTPGGGGGVFGTPLAITTVRGGRYGAGGGGGSAAAAGSGSGGVAADPAYMPFVVQLARQLAGWARVVVSSGLPQCPPQAVVQITDALAGALLLALQPLQSEATAGAEQQLQAADRQQLASSLLSTVPQLCDLASSGSISTPLAAQLLLESTRHLATHDWLSLLLNHLDLGQHILAAAGHAATIAAAAAAAPGSSAAAVAAGRRGGDATTAAGDLGMLALALVVAQIPDGARALYDRSVVDQVVAAGRHLLSGSGGRLAAFSVVAVTGTGPYRPRADGTYASTANCGGGGVLTRGSLGGQAPPDTCGAYLATEAAGYGSAAAGYGAEIWSPVHRQWCTLLQFSSALLRTLGQHLNLEREALDLLLSLEPRLMLAVLPPGGDSLQPLTMAGVVELEAALFLLGELTAYLGGWHMVLPASLLNFRTAVSTLLTWLAQPTLAKSFAVDCRPRTHREAELAALPAAGIPSTDGWFRACTVGAAAPPTGGTGGPSAAAAGGGGLGSPIAGAISSAGALLARMASEAVPSTPGGSGIGGGGAAAGPSTPGGFGASPGRTASVMLGGGVGAAAGGGAGGGGGGNGTCSEYSAQMAEKLYTCAHHALVFLVASSPQLSPGEAASLGPAWPRPRDLTALLEQCMCAAESLARHPDTPATHARRSHSMRQLVRVGHLCDSFLAVVGGNGASAHGTLGAKEQLAREWLASMELGAGGGGGGFGLGGCPRMVPAS